MTDPDLSTLTTEQLRALLHERAGDILAEIGRRSLPARRTVDRACLVCGEPMTGVLLHRRTCGDVCRSRLSYWNRVARTDPSAAHRLRLEAKGYLPDSRRVRRPPGQPAYAG
jgi:hypothetical protein